ncbi:TetR/AcrR family transcriptional regulator [Lactobacillus mulieris]|nr:TetR/AcrR family transcriptional regulator [Lactobacillus mulieris]MCZ3624532.1 TetR/AcrR family transcriptional regulator [Lactobacillus mulieris]MCZ3690787.1 TetR/AcrR family transcriptional regulator [Lactobacillus mulieris]MCZ3696755.1 TetR/AcrR family transcriptional regulator [Lactobacillus mulieris]MCZ3702832.1 TetR/AcrR family transcriptional regulator [Lactobacillus mulieris]MCZ3706007.1 TetR/AcrR family transcriptional regulator [Lactobacillus mulieris]
MPNPRLIITKQKVRAAMVTLINKKGLNKITVLDITKEAQINRSTFYRHYLDKPDLVEKLEKYYINKLEKIIDDNIDTLMIDQSPNNLRITYPLFIELIQEFNLHQEEYRAWLGPKGSSHLVNMAHNLIKSGIEKSLERNSAKYHPTKLIPKNYVLLLISEQIWTILYHWLVTADVDADELIEILMKTRYLSPTNMLGINDPN